MDKIIEFNKYTLGVAAALLLFAPAEFMPRETTLGLTVVYGIVALSLASCIAGILVYSSATAALSRGETDAPPILNTFGQCHLWSLIFAFSAPAALYAEKYLINPSGAPRDCAIQLAETGELTVSPDCAAALVGEN